MAGIPDAGHAPTTMQRIPAIIRKQGWRRFLRQSRDYVASRAFGRFRGSRALLTLEAESSRINGIEEALDFVYSFRSWGISINPFQNKREIAALSRRVEEIRPERVAEIGTGWGGTLFLFCVASSSNAILASIDLPPSLVGRGYPRWKEPLYRSFCRNGQLIELIRGDSHDPRTVSLVRNAMKEKPVDVLFIDGDHTYAGVKIDFELYSPLVRSGGLIALHDIVPSESNKEIEVSRFWNEIRGKYKTEEIIFEGNQLGIGLIFP